MSESTFTVEDQYAEYSDPTRILQSMDEQATMCLIMAQQCRQKARDHPELADSYRKEADAYLKRHSRIAKQRRGAIVVGVQNPDFVGPARYQRTAVQFFDRLEDAIASCATREHIIDPRYIVDLSPQPRKSEECILLLSQQDQLAGSLVEIGTVMGNGYERRAIYLRNDKPAEPKPLKHPTPCIGYTFRPQRACSVPAKIREKTLTSA